MFWILAEELQLPGVKRRNILKQFFIGLKVNSMEIYDHEIQIYNDLLQVRIPAFSFTKNPKCKIALKWWRQNRQMHCYIIT